MLVYVALCASGLSLVASVYAVAKPALIEAKKLKAKVEAATSSARQELAAAEAKVRAAAEAAVKAG